MSSAGILSARRSPFPFSLFLCLNNFILILESFSILNICGYRSTSNILDMNINAVALSMFIFVCCKCGHISCSESCT